MKLLVTAQKLPLRSLLHHEFCTAMYIILFCTVSSSFDSSEYKARDTMLYNIQRYSLGTLVSMGIGQELYFLTDEVQKDLSKCY